MVIYLETKGSKSKNKNVENLLYLEIFEVVLVHWNNVNNDYQQDSRILHTFVSKKFFGQLLDISPKSFMIESSFILKCGSLTKILNHYRQKIKQTFCLLIKM